MQVLSTWPAWAPEKIESAAFYSNDQIDLAVFKRPEFTGPAIQLHVSCLGSPPAATFRTNQKSRKCWRSKNRGTAMDTELLERTLTEAGLS